MDRAMHTSRRGEDASRFAREIARARRHSVLVRVLRLGLPATALAIVIGGVAVTFLARAIPGDVSVAAATIDSRGIVMQDPRMSGFDKNNRPYSMVAERAIQQLGGGGVDLETIRANIAVSDDTTARIDALKGFFDQGAQKLRLSDDIRVSTSDGMSIRLSSADIDLKTNTMTGDGPVEIDSDERSIRAGHIAVSNGGTGLSFGGRVRMTIHPSVRGEAPAAPPSPAALPSLVPSDAPRPLDFSSNETR